MFEIDGWSSDGDDDDELDDENHGLICLKYLFAGVESLDGLAHALRSVADDFDRRRAEGWRMTQPVDGAWVSLERDADSLGE